MYIELTDDGRVKIIIKGYIKETIDIFGKDVSQPVTSSLKHRLIEVNGYYEKLSE